LARQDATIGADEHKVVLGAAVIGKEETNKAIGARLALTRRALGYSLQTEFVSAFAPILDVSIARWNNYESGRQRITVDVALALCSRWDLTLDWIYAGKWSGLPHGLFLAIEEIERARASSPA
jgi:transcriptional regulator with XRE-family HTH domain